MILPILAILSVILAGVLGTVAWILSIVEIATSKEPEAEKENILWIVVVALMGLIGTAIYFIAARKKFVKS